MEKLPHAEVPHSEVECGVEVADMSHVPLGVCSGTFHGPHLRWANVENKGFTAMSNFHRLEYLFRWFMLITGIWHTLSIHRLALRRSQKLLRNVWNTEKWFWVITTTRSSTSHANVVVGEFSFRMRALSA